MRKVLIVFLLIAFALAVGFGCGKKESEEPAGKVPPEVKKAEVMDTTRMDSAMMESTMVESTAVDTTGEAQGGM
jgi:hypothetical protein